MSRLGLEISRSKLQKRVGANGFVTGIDIATELLKIAQHQDNPLLELEPEKIRQIKASYDDAIAGLESDQGVWHEELIYYTVARKGPN